MNLQEKAYETFKINPDVDELFMTTDGQPFFNEAAAKLHNREKGLEKVVSITREEAEKKFGKIKNSKPKATEAPKVKSLIEWEELTIAETEAAVAEIEDVKILEMALNQAQSKGAKKAITERIEELSK